VVERNHPLTKEPACAVKKRKNRNTWKEDRDSKAQKENLKKGEKTINGEKQYREDGGFRRGTSVGRRALCVLLN